MSQVFDPATGTYRDNIGTQYYTPDNKPASSGSTVQTYGPTGYLPGQIIGGIFVPNK